MSTRQITFPIEIEQRIAEDDSVRIVDEIIDKIVTRIPYCGMRSYGASLCYHAKNYHIRIHGTNHVASWY